MGGCDVATPVTRAAGRIIAAYLVLVTPTITIRPTRAIQDGPVTAGVCLFTVNFPFAAGFTGNIVAIPLAVSQVVEQDIRMTTLPVRVKTRQTAHLLTGTTAA